MSEVPKARKGRSQFVNRNRAERIIEPPQYAAMIKRFLWHMGAADPEALKLFVELRRALDEAETTAIQMLLNEGYSYRDLAKPLAVHHTAIFQRMLRRRGSSECA